jgi:hypothetical protein
MQGFSSYDMRTSTPATVQWFTGLVKKYKKNKKNS